MNKWLGEREREREKIRHFVFGSNSREERENLDYWMVTIGGVSSDKSSNNHGDMISSTSFEQSVELTRMIWASNWDFRRTGSNAFFTESLQRSQISSHCFSFSRISTRIVSTWSRAVYRMADRWIEPLPRWYMHPCFSTEPNPRHSISPFGWMSECSLNHRRSVPRSMT